MKVVIISSTNILQDLYEVVFAKSNLCTPFCIFTRVGHVHVEARATGTLASVVSSVLVVEESTGGEDAVINFFSRQVTTSSIKQFNVLYSFV